MFKKLLQTVPLLQDRLMQSEGQSELLAITELVCFLSLIILNHSLIPQRFRRVFQVQGLTIPRRSEERRVGKECSS